MTALESARDALVEAALEWAVAEVPSLVRDRLAQRLCDRADAYRLARAQLPPWVRPCGCMFSELEPHRQTVWCPEHLKAMARPAPGNARHIHLWRDGTDACACGAVAPFARYLGKGASWDEDLGGGDR